VAYVEFLALFFILSAFPEDVSNCERGAA